MSSIQQISPEEIKPLHKPRQRALLKRLAKDMAANGWTGRPLLVIERNGEYFAWTGSHRIAAAIEAELEAVPCYIIDEANLPEETTADYGHLMDYDRLNIIRQTGDETAIHIMWEEGRS
jgi:ParB-like chromosome segregation protein Spo0J